MRTSIAPLALVVALLAGLAGARATDAQNSAGAEKLSEREEVTALDLVVGLRRGEAVIAAPRELEGADFEVVGLERPLAVVATDTNVDREPWRLLVLVDRRFAGLATMRWATAALAELAPALVELGEVEVVVIDEEEAQTLVAPTRDATLVDDMLSGVFLGTARHAVVDLREEFALVARGMPEAEKLELGVTTRAAEQRLVVDHLDAILEQAIDTPPGSRRALLLVSDGFDTRPGAVYGEGGGDASVAGLVDDWAATLAAYGWTVVALTSPASAERNFGFQPGSDLRTVGGSAPGLTARLDGNLDPERAAALHELGQRLAENGELDKAEAELREALRYYRDHAKYARQRAAVLVDLGTVLLSREETTAARDVLRRAVELDPERAAELPFEAARLEAPQEVLERAVAASAGRLVRDADALASALADLGQRVRLTVQLEGPPDGDLHQVKVEMLGGGLSVEGPRWIRFGTPEAIQAWRVRRLLAGHLEAGDLPVKARFAVTEPGYGFRRGKLEVEIGGEPAPVGPELRLTLGTGGEAGPAEVTSRSVSLSGGVARLPVTIQTDDLWLAVVVDEVATGRWGGAAIEP